MIKKDPFNNYIQVCSNNCTIVEADSDKDSTVCILPPVSTKYSDKNFNIEKVRHLKTGLYFQKRSSNNLNTLFDGDLVVHYDDHKVDCHVGMKFKDGYVGIINKIKFFIPQEIPNSEYVNNLVI